MKEAETMGIRALGLHQQRPNGVNSKQQKSVHSGMPGHQFQTHVGPTVPDNMYKSHHHYSHPHHSASSSKAFHPHSVDFNQSKFKNQKNGGGKPGFKRTASFGDAHTLVNAESLTRVRPSSGGASFPVPVNKNNVFKPIPKSVSPIDFSSPSPTRYGNTSSPPKSSSPDGFFAMAKFNDSPEPSSLPKPPNHWQGADPFTLFNLKPNRPISCNQEFRMHQTPFDIDFTAHLKTLLKVEM